MTYAKHFKPAPVPKPIPVPQSKPAIKGQVKNAAGGYAFAIGDWQKLMRFLMLGTEGGSYYEGEKQLTLAAASVVLRCLQEDPIRVTDTIVAVSDGGLAPSNSPAIFALALATQHENEVVRNYAFSKLSDVCRIGTHLFEFMDVYTTLNKSKSLGRMARRWIGAWYTAKNNKDLAYGLVKYQQRDGWSNRDVLRLAHPKADNAEQNLIFNWTIGKMGFEWPNRGTEDTDLPGLKFISAFEAAKSTSKEGLLALIRQYNLPREALPTQWLNDADVWSAMLPSMGYTAIMRNLPKMTELGMFDNPFSDGLKLVVSKLTDPAFIKKSRVHPLVILNALKTYAGGHGIRGGKTWTPSPKIATALDTAFYAAFDNVEPLDKNVLIAIDASGSMDAAVSGMSNLSCREAGVALALVYLKQNPNTHVIGFTTRVTDCSFLHAGMRMDEALRLFDRYVVPEGTACNLPFEFAQSHRWDIDGVLMITDSQSWAGMNHTYAAADNLRKWLNHPLRWMLVQATYNSTSIQNPQDTESFEYAGFGANVVTIANEFFKGNL